MEQASGSLGAGESRRCRPAPHPVGSVEWEGWERQLAADDVARLVVAALPSLDLQPLWESYSGRGSLPYSPELMLAMVLVEKQRGRSSPSQWHRSQRDSVALLWVGQGIQPARSVWYEFRDRLAPFFEGWNEQVLRRAIETGLTTAEEAATDGTLIAACASRHRLLNQSQLTSRLEQLAAACAEDERPRGVVQKKASGWQQRPRDASSNVSVIGARTSCCSRGSPPTRASVRPNACLRSGW